MPRRFVKVLKEEIEEAFFYPSDLVKLILKQLSPSGLVKGSGYNYISMLRVSLYIHHYSPPL